MTIHVLVKAWYILSVQQLIGHWWKELSYLQRTVYDTTDTEEKRKKKALLSTHYERLVKREKNVVIYTNIIFV